MNISGQATITGNGVILSGYYAITITGNKKPKLFELSSPYFPIDRFQWPTDAILRISNVSGSNIAAVGRKIKSSSDSISSNRSGAFYYADTVDLIGTCHGFGRNDLTFYSGYNFYNAFYPVGYFHPPYGETPSLFKMNQDGFANLYQGVCFDMNITEYNEQFGIVSRVAPDAGASTQTLNPGTLAQIMSLKETCPDGTIAVSTYYEEVNVNRIPGTASSITSPTLYNHDPIPTSLDNYDTWVDGRYKYTVDNTDPKVPVNNITFGGDGRALPNYASGDTNHSKLNNTLCYAQLFETDTSIGRLTNGIQRIETPDILWGAIGSQVSAAGQEPWHYWHFIFKENAETIPFTSDFKQIRPGSTRRTISEGTQMFTPVLSSEDMYWQNRQCPDTVDFLPHTFGASIYACPSEHFDIPYYAATKKFGFYGTRFLNSCSRLNLKETWNGVENALELTGPASVLAPDTEPEDIDSEGAWSFASYDNLLRVANAEERYSNMYAFNKGFFLWANTGCIYPDWRWAKLTSDYHGFGSIFSGMVLKFQYVYENGLSSFLSGEPRVIIKAGETSSEFSILDSGKYSDLLFTNDAYMSFAKQMDSIVSGDGIYYWQGLEKDYAYYISNCQSGINALLYNYINSGREKRIRTRFFESVIRGNPIDLFPMNHVMFSTDLAREYLESTGWSRADGGFGKGSKLPPIQRRYFEGAYGNASASSGIASVINALSIAKDAAFYPGFFNTYGFGKAMPTPYYVPVESGFIKDTAGRSYTPSGWLAVGYNEIGKLDKNFSCFTPIITQQPLAKTFCKIGQHPTLRVTAVDYHSIPEDKISYRYPEIIYWTHKLKISNSSFRNNYPLKYRWFRVLKTQYNDFKLTANFGLAHFSDPNGDWCALEGDKRTCTIIHPKECFPAYNGGISEDGYTFIQGAKKDSDENYYYLCLIQGRFGIRISEPAELVIENWVRFDISQKNGMNVPGQITVKFIVNDIYGTDNTITFSSSTSPAYAGYQRDKTAEPESVVEQKIPPPNAGFGDVSASRFIGPYGYVGATRSYAPDTLKDTRGLREIWGRMLDYGNLISLSKAISQKEGDLLYGYKHLPECTNYAMADGKHGVRVEPFVNGNRITHWTLRQQAFASLDSKQGMKWDKIGHVGSLYPPASNTWEIESPNMGIGHWQWGTNLGSIKRFGYLSRPENNDLVLLGGGFSTSSPVSEEWLKKIKNKFINRTTLAGANCGYTPYGLGRNMLYYIEAFDRFYLICDPVKKKNVQNISFMCPGLRHTNSAIQYFWMGQPNNTYVERRPMYGPYAFQWRVKRHNRDRNGNGISQGFYSPSYGTRYELMYDAPAIYGLYVKREASSEYMSHVTEVRALRKKLFGIISDWGTFRSLWFGEAGSEGTSRRYGNFTFSCDPTHWAYNKDMCDYVSAAKGLANGQDFRAYSCPQDRLEKGECFDPCLSIRYGQGFFPGGKSQSMFGYSSDTSTNLNNKNVRLVPQATFKQDALQIRDEQSNVNKDIFFRSPVNTPHARVWRGLMAVDGLSSLSPEGIVGISPCRDGGSDHCNYLTPTIHLDTSSTMIGHTSSFNASQGYAANLYQQYDMRGGD